LSHEEEQPNPPAPETPGAIESLKILFSASRGYWLVNQINLGDGIAYFGMLTLMTIYLQDNIGFSTNLSTSAVSVFSGLVTVTVALGGGWVSDRLGVRRALGVAVGAILAGRVLLVGSPLGGVTELIQGLAWSSIVVMAIGEGILQPALYSGVKEYTDKRTATLGYAFIYAIMNLGIALGGFVSPFVREWWAGQEGISLAENPRAGIEGAFWLFILVTAAMLIVHIIFFNKRVEDHDRVIKPEEMLVEPVMGWREKLRRLPILDRRFQFFIFVLLPVRTLFAHQFLTIPDYVTRAFPASIGAHLEWVNMINPIVIVIGVPVFAMLTIRARVVDMMIVGTTVSALSTVLLIGQPSVPHLIAYMIFFALGEAIWSSRFLEYVADIAPANRVGIYMGIATIPWFLAKTTTGLYAGSALERWVPMTGPQDPGTMWLIYGLIACASPIGLIMARRWLLGGVHNEGVGSRN
jgi:proton-dependent oligopeptide transporter, POT family